MKIDIRRNLKSLLPHLKKAQEDNLNEADTLQRIIKVFENVLGYDCLSEITREQQIREKYADLAIRIDGAIRLLVEAKAAATVLRDRHIEQAQRYASEGNIRWVVLTNGMVWNLYHLSFEEGIEYERAFTVDLSVDPIDKAAELLALLHRQSVIRGEHEDFWKKRTAMSAKSIGKVLFHEETLKLIRRRIRKQEGILVDEEDLGVAIQSLFSAETREQIGPFKIRRKRQIRKEEKAGEPEIAVGKGLAPTNVEVGTLGGRKTQEPGQS